MPKSTLKSPSLFCSDLTLYIDEKRSDFKDSGDADEDVVEEDGVEANDDDANESKYDDSSKVGLEARGPSRCLVDGLV